jgi:hypothetical protein
VHIGGAFGLIARPRDQQSHRAATTVSASYITAESRARDEID